MTTHQKTEPKPSIPDDLTERTDHDVMECLIGKDVMKQVDELIEELDRESTANLF